MPPTPQTSVTRPAAHPRELALDPGRFHEPRRPDCPWCGSRWLRTRLRTRDLLQHKPGSFALDRALAPLLRRTRFSNSYRVLARR
ncbi:hypothetical protein GCM10023080_020220 [Streptomyces pseudoechinosporeus]